MTLIVGIVLLVFGIIFVCAKIVLDDVRKSHDGFCKYHREDVP